MIEQNDDRDTSKKIKKWSCHVIQQSHFWVFIQKNWNQDLKEVLAPLWSLQNYLS